MHRARLAGGLSARFQAAKNHMVSKFVHDNVGIFSEANKSPTRTILSELPASTNINLWVAAAVNARHVSCVVEIVLAVVIFYFRAHKNLQRIDIEPKITF